MHVERHFSLNPRHEDLSDAIGKSALANDELLLLLPAPIELANPDIVSRVPPRASGCLVKACAHPTPLPIELARAGGDFTRIEA